MLAAVLFDLDETLILDEPVSHHAFRIVAQAANNSNAKNLAQIAENQAKALWTQLPEDLLAYTTRVGHSALEGLWADYETSIPEEAALQTWTARYREQTWQNALDACAVEGNANALAELWVQVRRQFPIFPDADELLVALKPHCKLGIVTNGVQKLQRAKLEGCGLLHWFDAVVISGEVGVGKPNPEIFYGICQTLGVDPKDTVMVGDNSERDVLGAHNAGLKSAWLERGYKPKTVDANVEVKHLLELLPWLRTQFASI